MSTTAIGNDGFIENQKSKMFSLVQSATPADDICVAGISGDFPNCSNVDELEHNLYNKVRIHCFNT